MCVCKILISMSVDHVIELLKNLKDSALVGSCWKQNLKAKESLEDLRISNMWYNVTYMVLHVVLLLENSNKVEK